MEDNGKEHEVLTNEVMNAAVKAAEKEMSKVIIIIMPMYFLGDHECVCAVCLLVHIHA